MITFDAHFDGENLRPEAPIALPQNVRLRVTVVAESTKETSPQEVPSPPEGRGLFGMLVDEELLIDGPADWSLELDHYLYGTPKRGDGREA
ncbi:hypothetical protein I41_02670 [Lacipirellula limnantheis]|uniref:Uncharacterized protein n=1 Tax=Lacipirellula limnantheis TaxID=2528024 RepID=A0A517TRW4_9BACT|nr:hypothetical protein I41_02670 [Lacipirellula limnantheis]